MEIKSYTPGTPSWIDLGTTDVDAAATFYGELFDWEIADLGPDAGGYRMCTLNGKFVAGLGPAQRDDVPPYWNTYIAVDDADAIAAKIVDAGGQAYMEPMDVMEAGRMAVFADPTGAQISIWQAKDHSGSQLANEPGAFCWNELATRDVATAKAFYTTVFGWEINDVDMGSMTYTIFNLPTKPGDDKTVAGLFEMTDDIPKDVPSNWGVYFNVANTDEAVAKATELGAELVMGPIDIMPGRFAMLKDPQGARFHVLQFPYS